MATFGDALAALGDYRSELVNRQMSAPVPEAQAMAFRASAAGAGDLPLQNVHATGVGIRGGKQPAGAHEFVIKVYVFDQVHVEAAKSEPFLTTYQNVEIDVEYLPIQFAFAKKKSAKRMTTRSRSRAPRDHSATPVTPAPPFSTRIQDGPSPSSSRETE